MKTNSLNRKNLLLSDIRTNDIGSLTTREEIDLKWNELSKKVNQSKRNSYIDCHTNFIAQVSQNKDLSRDCLEQLKLMNISIDQFLKIEKASDKESFLVKNINLNIE